MIARRYVTGALTVALGIALAVGHAALAAGTPKVNFKLIYQAALLSNQAYQGKSEIIGDYPGLSAWVATPGHTDVQYVLIINDKRKAQVIAVRGTDNNVNWNLDMDTRSVEDQKDGILMHQGFRKAAEAIYHNVKPRLKRDYRTYLTGHSLGGAVAAILGTYLIDDGYHIAAIYTFGQPRFTNRAGAERYRNMPLLRVVNQDDVVAAFPDDSASGKHVYAHTGAAINILSGPYYVYFDVNQSIKFSPGVLARYFTQISVEDHKLEWYLKHLRAKLDGGIEVSFAERDKYIVRVKPGLGATTGVKTDYKTNFNAQQ